MPILEDGATPATRADIAGAQGIAQTKLRQLEAQQAEYFGRHRWSDARGLTAPIADQRAWLQDLARYAAGLDIPSGAPARDVRELLAFRATLERAHDAALETARRKYEQQGSDVRREYAQLLEAWLSLEAFSQDAFAVTGDERFRALLPAAPAQRPMFTTLQFERQARGVEAPVIDRRRWASLLPAA